MIEEESKKLTQLDHVNALVRAAVKLQTQINTGSHNETINILATSKDKESHAEEAKKGRKQASHILTQLASLIDLVDPSLKMQKMAGKGRASLVKDLTGLPNASDHYADCIEQVCDDLLETSDKQIDLIKQKGKAPVEVARTVENGKLGYEKRLRTENALKKP